VVGLSRQIADILSGPKPYRTPAEIQHNLVCLRMRSGTETGDDDADEAQREQEARANPITIELDFRQVGSADDLWDEIDRKLGFDGFGRNLDAFTDVLRGGFGHFQPWEFIKLVVRGKQAAEAHYPKWSILEDGINNSVAGEYGEQVAAVEWAEE
jgi:hypothetical protein